jgi:hypothetical protein
MRIPRTSPSSVFATDLASAYGHGSSVPIHGLFFVSRSASSFDLTSCSSDGSGHAHHSRINGSRLQSCAPSRYRHRCDPPPCSEYLSRYARLDRSCICFCFAENPTFPSHSPRITNKKENSERKVIQLCLRLRGVLATGLKRVHMQLCQANGAEGRRIGRLAVQSKGDTFPVCAQ